MREYLRWIVGGIVVMVLLAIIVFVIWAETLLGPAVQAQAALQSDEQAEVIVGDWLVFQPERPATTGLIIYPGARVAPASYAPAAHAIADEGYLVVIVPMPLNLAFFGADRANDVISAFPEIDHWAVAGHSLGGAMAARFVHSHPSVVEGLVLWAAYPAASDDLSEQPITVTSIYGTRDALASIDEIEASHALLPADTTFVAIEGGNHSQFGWYGFQAGDNEATISPDEQQAQIISATLELLSKIEAPQ